MRVRLLLLNILLAVLWMFMWNAIDIFTLLFGFALGYLLLGVISRVTVQDKDGYGVKGWRLFSFAFYFMRILVIANLQVAREIVTPGFGMSPGILRYDVSGMTELQITSLANAITLTPGTLSVDVSDEGDALFVHCMYASDRDATIRELDELRDRLMKEVFG
ncbi:MAG: Na+/H+ antiporter subunit E [Phycisphaeraceae bacterium]|nr:Na+/H+ antiporter subunit E [Phycisphaeraceae bacterium]